MCKVSHPVQTKRLARLVSHWNDALQTPEHVTAIVHSLMYPFMLLEMFVFSLSEKYKHNVGKIL